MTGVGALNAGHGYIPRHLSGQVSDFKDEPDGGVSFSHPAAAGALTPSSPRTHLTQEQFLQTFDQPTRFTNLSDSIRGQYAPADSAVKTPARQTNETIARYLRQALERGTSSQGKSIGTVGLVSALGGGVPGASGPLGRCALVYMGDCLVHSPTLEQHLLDVAEVLETFRRHKLYAKSSKCEFGRQELGFLGQRLSAAGVSVDPRKVQSIVEWSTPTSCTEVLRFTGLANYYCRFVERRS